MQYALLIFESPEAFATRKTPENNPYNGAWRAYYKAVVEAGIYVGPDEAGIEEATVCVLSSEELRTHMRECGLAAARGLTWPAAARQMMDVIQRVASQ